MFLFFNDTTTTEIYTLYLHDALPILSARHIGSGDHRGTRKREQPRFGADKDPHPLRLADIVEEADQLLLDRKSTRLNSSHANISYAVFCLKKKHERYSNSHRLLVCAV